MPTPTPVKVVTLSDHEKPKVFFVVSVENAGKVQLRLLPTQHVPLSDDGNEYVEGDTTKIVNADKVKRTKFPIGTVFGIDKCRSDLSFYEARSAVMYALEPEQEVDTPDLYVSEWRKYKASSSASVSDADAPVIAKSSLYHRLKTSRTLAPPTIEKDEFYIDPEKWYLLCRNIRQREHTLLKGPTGCGKTVLVSFLAKAFSKSMFSYNMGEMHDPVAGLVGVNRLKSADGITVSEFDLANFARELDTPNALFLWDEVSRMPFQGSNLLFPVLDPTQGNSLPLSYNQSDQIRKIPLGDNSVIFATANLGSEYTGVIPMDRAFKDRMFLVEIDYPPKEQETALLHKKYGLSVKEASQIIGIVDSVRTAYKAGNLSTGVSVRYTQAIASLVRDGFTVLFAVKAVLLPLFDGDEDTGDKKTVLTVIASR